MAFSLDFFASGSANFSFDSLAPSADSTSALATATATETATATTTAVATEAASGAPASSTRAEARSRLNDDRSDWRKSHPRGFVAVPERFPDGGMNMFSWACAVPGVATTDWAGGVYSFVMSFPDDYPTKPPQCVLTKGLFHPNVSPTGTIALPIFVTGGDSDVKSAAATAASTPPAAAAAFGFWREEVTFRDILLAIQKMLANPVLSDRRYIVQAEPARLLTADPAAYRKRIQAEAKRYASDADSKTSEQASTASFVVSPPSTSATTAAAINAFTIPATATAAAAPTATFGGADSGGATGMETD